MDQRKHDILPAQEQQSGNTAGEPSHPRTRTGPSEDTHLFREHSSLEPRLGTQLAYNRCACLKPRTHD